MAEPDMLLLKAEIVSDPLARGYSGMTDAQVAASLNTKNRTRQLDRLDAADIYEAVDVTEFLAKTNAQQTEIWNILQIGAVNGLVVAVGSKARSRFITIFGAGSATITAIAAKMTLSISRATELGWDEIKVGWVQMARAAQ